MIQNLMEMDLKFESYDLLKTKIGDEAAKAVVNLVQAETLDVTKKREGLLATKEDLAKLETNLNGKISALKANLNGKISALESKIYTVGIGLGIFQLVTIVGAVLAIIKFIKG